MSSSVIQTHGLSKRYGRTLAVDEIDFQVEAGQVFGFLGPNGSGKTTTIGMLLGIISVTGGSFRLFGGSSPAELHAARRRIGATLEYPNFYPYLSGYDNLRIVANVKGRGHADIQRTLDMVGLAARQKDTFKKYSLGMKQRLALAATMIGDPELIILDEPANGLDPEGMREIRDIIGALAGAGKTIFLSSHLLWEVERTCTHVAIIKKGRIVKTSSVQELTADGIAVTLRAHDQAALRAAAERFPGTRTVRQDGDDIVAELETDDFAALNEFLTTQGIYVSRLTPRSVSLEDVFMDLTGAAERGMGDVS